MELASLAKKRKDELATLEDSMLVADALRHAPGLDEEI